MLAAGCDDIKAMADKARMQMRKKIPELEEALHGFMADHQRLMLRLMLKHIDTLDAQILELDQEIRKKMEPVYEQVQLIDTITKAGQPGQPSMPHEKGGVADRRSSS